MRRATGGRLHRRDRSRPSTPASTGRSSPSRMCCRGARAWRKTWPRTPWRWCTDSGRGSPSWTARPATCGAPPPTWRLRRSGAESRRRRQCCGSPHSGSCAAGDARVGRAVLGRSAAACRPARPRRSRCGTSTTARWPSRRRERSPRARRRPTCSAAGSHWLNARPARCTVDRRGGGVVTADDTFEAPGPASSPRCPPFRERNRHDRSDRPAAYGTPARPVANPPGGRGVDRPAAARRGTGRSHRAHRTPCRRSSRSPCRAPARSTPSSRRRSASGSRPARGVRGPARSHGREVRRHPRGWPGRDAGAGLRQW